MDSVLRHLDLTSSTEVDIEVGLRERNVPSRSSRGRYLSKVLRGATTALLGGCVLLAVYDSILRKYTQTTG
jgi:hypothetical protein